MANFDATKGGASATSYATVDDADGYFEFEFGADEWAEIDDDTKEKLLVTATRMIDRLKPLYDKDDSGQALNFPVQSNNTTLGDGFAEAKVACILQALHIYRNNGAMIEAKTNEIYGLKADSLGKTSREISGTNMFGKWAPGFLSQLKNFVDLEMRVSRA